jgi:lipopolysaccharide exporter
MQFFRYGKVKLRFRPNFLRSDLFAAIFSFSGQSALRLGSSIILTRILRPEAYGVMAALVAISAAVELVADMNVGIFIVRDKNGDQADYLNTAWTIRLCRQAINAAILFLGAPFIANFLFRQPQLVLPLQVYAFSFLIGGFESMAVPLAIRHKRARVVMYMELCASVFATFFTVIYCHFYADFWGLIYGTLLGKAISTVLSHFLDKQYRVRLTFDRSIAEEVLGFSKYTMPSSLLTLTMSQFDKVVFLRLFSLDLLGIYGLAGNIAGSIETLITKISQSVLYPRCAHNFRENRNTSVERYYKENVKLFGIMLVLPPAIGGAAHLIIGTLYPPSFSLSAIVLQALMLRAAFLSLAACSEDLLIAAGEYQVILIGNIWRAASLGFCSFLGFYLHGFLGFIYGVAMSGFAPLVYYFQLQWKKGLMIWHYEVYRILSMAVVAVASSASARAILSTFPHLQ